MPSSKFIVLVGALAAFAGAHLATAQTSAVANLTVYSGNGQVACECFHATLQAFLPIVVKATDTSAKPVANATVTWTVTSGQATLLPTGTVSSPGGTLTLTSTTDSNGLASVLPKFIVYSQIGNSLTPFTVNTVLASVNNQSQTFTLTQSYEDSTGNAMITANTPTYDSAFIGQSTISGPAGTTLSTPIQVFVGGEGLASNGVGNVSIRIFNLQTSPTMTCLPVAGTNADPATVLSLSSGNASCYPVLTGGGSGQYYLLIGSVPYDYQDSTVTLNAQYLQAFGPYSFTSVPGTPTAVVALQGDNQVAAAGQALTTLKAELVDAKGNSVPGATMTWNAVPNNGGAALSNTTFTTDNNGVVSTDVALYAPAATGVAITVALAGGSSISYTFHESLAGSITALTKVSGDTQSAQVGTAFSQALVVKVTNGSNAVQNYPVQFTYTGPVTLSASTVYSTSAGLAQVTVTAGSTTGTATVTATVGSLTQTFNLTVTAAQTTATPTAIQKLSGDSQTAIISTSFASPLAVQVVSATGVVSNYTVNFSSTGPVTVASSAITDSSGKATVTVQAGATAGAATVTASVPGYSVTFTLTVLPLGPTLTSSSFLNGASGQAGYISPCSIATISAAGLTPDGISDLSPGQIVGRLPYQVGGISVSFDGTSAPIFNVAMGATLPQVMVQVPCEVTPGSAVPVTVKVGQGSSSTTTQVLTVSPGIFETVMSDGSKRAVVVRDDGSFADIGGLISNPARRGEKVRIYLTGLGVTIPSVATNSIQNPNADLIGADAVVAGTLVIGVGSSNVTVLSARQAPSLIGVYEVQFALPGSVQTGNDVVLSVGIIPQGAPLTQQANYAQNSKIPIQ